MENENSDLVKIKLDFPKNTNSVTLNYYTYIKVDTKKIYIYKVEA